MTETSYTDSKGQALLTDLSTYEKTIFSIDLETLDDLSLQPQVNDIKLVLRPGAVNYLEIPFSHYGSLEGQIPNPENKMMLGYKVSLLDDFNKNIVSSYSDMSGYFIVDNIPYGTYTCILEKSGKEIKKINNLKVNNSIKYLDLTSEFIN